MSQCPSCGWHNEPASRFCVSCGTALAGQTQEPPPAPAAPAKTPSPHAIEPPPGQTSGIGPTEAAALTPEPAAPHVVATNSTSQQPPSSQLPFAETAPPLESSVTPAQPSPVAAPRYPAALPHPEPGGNPDHVSEHAPRVLVGFLASYEAVELGQFWPIHQGKNVVGRQGATGDIDIAIAHATTSSHHALLKAAARPGRVSIEDTSSTNGTFVNDVALSPGQSHELSDGDRVRFGLFTAIIKII